MDMLSAVMEVAASVDAPTTTPVNDVTDTSVGTTAGSNISRSISPAGSSGRDTSGPGAGKGAESSDIDDEEANSRENAQLSAPIQPTGMSEAARDMHAKLESQQEDIRNGKHPSIVEDSKRQEELKRRRQETAEEHCRLLVRNVDELRQAEIRDNDVQTKVALERTQEELLDDVHQRIRKAKIEGGLIAREGDMNASIIGSGSEATDKFGGVTPFGRKRARLMPPRSPIKVTAEAVLAKAEARRIRTITLSDIEMRRDFQAIIVDWRERATRYLSTYNNSHWTKVNVYQDSFRVRGVVFNKGDPVVVTSRVTGEEFHGEITVVKPKAIFLSLYGGVKTRIFVDHISTGRLTVTRADVKSSGR